MEKMMITIMGTVGDEEETGLLYLLQEGTACPIVQKGIAGRWL
jgi:hypothetical protein